MAQSHPCPPISASAVFLLFIRLQSFFSFYLARRGFRPMLDGKLCQAFLGSSGKLRKDRRLSVVKSDLLLGE